MYTVVNLYQVSPGMLDQRNNLYLEVVCVSHLCVETFQQVWNIILMILFTEDIHRYIILNIDIFVALLEVNSSLSLHNSQKEKLFLRHSRKYMCLNKCYY